MFTTKTLTPDILDNPHAFVRGSGWDHTSAGASWPTVGLLFAAWSTLMKGCGAPILLSLPLNFTELAMNNPPPPYQEEDPAGVLPPYNSTVNVVPFFPPSAPPAPSSTSPWLRLVTRVRRALVGPPRHPEHHEMQALRRR
ncbi:hypothetical protein B0H11DRAFT_2269469 [Mycena galericulata]|nr:hypothetical protein B0H11DRAFT_2269469 [Mycena galericulata]